MEKCRRMKRQPFNFKELDMFLTLKILDNTPGVLSLGKLWGDHGYSYEWTNGQKPCLIKNGVRIQCNTENYVPIVVLGLSTTSSWSSSAYPASLPQESKGSTPIPVSVDSRKQMSPNRGTWIHTQPKIQKPTKMRITHTNGVTRLIRKYLNGFKNSGKSCGWKLCWTSWSKSPWSQWLTHELFQWTLFRATETSVTG